MNSRVDDQPEYRVVWAEIINGEVIPHISMLSSFQEAVADADAKRSAHNHHGVFIEARPQSKDRWACPWENMPETRSRAFTKEPIARICAALLWAAGGLVAWDLPAMRFTGWLGFGIGVGAVIIGLCVFYDDLC